LIIGDWSLTHWQPADLDEVRPDRFVINNDKARPLLKGEGVVVGRFFELTTWRRDGLIARLRERGFNVRTLRDRIAALPSIEPVDPPGTESARPLAARERVAIFDAATLHWRDLEPVEVDGKPAVRLASNVALRRRKSRGRADFYISALSQRGAINLRPASETAALLHAYSQIAASRRPATLEAAEHDDQIHLPQRDVTLPPPHAETLDLLTLDGADRWTFAKATLPLVIDTLETLAIRLRVAR
jgi:hypothetical protein